MKRVGEALAENALDAALRDIDRAWRCDPDDAEALAPVYGRLLALEDRDHDATLRLLQRVSAPDPDVAALTAHSLFQLRRGEEARQHLESALGDYCVMPGGLLAHIATESLQYSDSRATGWIGVGPTFEFVGELAGDVPQHALEIRLDREAGFIQPVCAPLKDGRRSFHFKLPQLAPGSTLRVSCHGVPLLGSGLTIPMEFGLDGRAADSGRVIAGWARLGWLPAHPVRLCLRDEHRGRHWVKTRSAAQPGLRWPFAVDLRGTVLRGSRIEITALLPDGRWMPLTDSPLLFARAVRLAGCKSSPLREWGANKVIGARRSVAKRPPSTDVIIPVYRGRHETLACIDAALATARTARILVVDDASPDPELAAALDELKAAGRITLMRNSSNLGFVASVNRALACHRNHDAVLLNSDTLVFGDWLERLRAAAYRAPDIGTVTPFSNCGAIASYPGPGERPLSTDEAMALDRLAASTHAQLGHEIPVGVGFCLYLRRDCLREVGDFDASLFGKGYGEETDFCLRARRLGWSHQLAADVFVYHAGGRSFGSRRAALLDRGQRLINLRHPGYDTFIADFLAQDPLNPLRRRLDEQRLSAIEGRFVLLLTLALSGGVQRFVTERCRDIRARGLVPLLLRPHTARDPGCCELWTEALDVPNLRYEIPSDLAGLTALLRGLRVEEIEIQHFLDLDARVIEMVRTLDVPYDVFIHDYAWICPRITLLDGRGRYCGEPKISACNSCVRRNGSNLRESISVADLRHRSNTWLSTARHVIAPSVDAASRLSKYFPTTIEVRGYTVPSPAVPQRQYSSDSILRVAVIGAIGVHKGYDVLLNCARDARARNLSLHFIVVGYTHKNGPLTDTGKVSVTGRYGEGEAAHLLRREKPAVAFLPSVTPETWCYAMDEALAAGLPVVAFDIGAIAERVRATGLGMLLPRNESPQSINDRLLAFDQHTSLPLEADEGSYQGTGKQRTMNKSSNGDTALSDALSASVQVLPLPAGLYLFSVKAAAPVAEPTARQLRLPAMHVGLGPGVRSDQVEFIAGPATSGAWLFAHEDLLVTKVNASGATLVLTSVRAPAGEALSIKVERLDGRTDASTPVAAGTSTEPQRIAVKADKNTTAAPAVNAADNGALPVHIGAHVRARGDMSFANVPWAGRVAPGLWIESFSVRPLEHLDARDIEYKGLTGSGFETPWLSDDKMCGTKGMSVPLVGFAIRLKPGRHSAAYDCEYSGYFKSGMTIGPLRNGAPCRSTVANDPLEGIQVRIYKRPTAGKQAAPALEPHTTTKGPSFGRFRDEEPANGKRKPTKAKPAAKRAVPASRRQNGSAHPTQRSLARRS